VTDPGAPGDGRAHRVIIVGVLNVTTDSFSDGGRYLEHTAALQHARQLVADGADVVDVGGESTRPGAERVGIDEEQRRVLPVIRDLAREGIRVSVDTMNAVTARAAVEAGAVIVNDVAAALADEAMLEVAAEVTTAGGLYIASHWRGHSATMNQLAHYADAVVDVRDELGTRIEALLAAGARPQGLVIDPGLGFAKAAEHNWAVLRDIELIQGLGYPVLVGASRKRFLAPLLAEGARMAERDLPTAVLSALLAERGVWGVRVHNVAATRVAVDVVEHLRRP